MGCVNFTEFGNGQMNWSGFPLRLGSGATYERWATPPLPGGCTLPSTYPLPRAVLPTCTLSSVRPSRSFPSARAHRRSRHHPHWCPASPVRPSRSSPSVRSVTPHPPPSPPLISHLSPVLLSPLAPSALTRSASRYPFSCRSTLRGHWRTFPPR